MYGGTITSVLINVPGEAASAITCLDGYQMAKKGRAGAALSIAAIGSFIGGAIATVGLVFAGPALAHMGLKFGPPEFFALMVLGLSLVTGLAGKSILKAVIMAAFGLLLGMVGMDPALGSPRFTFGQMDLLGGLELVPVVMGLMGVSEVLLVVESPFREVFLKTPWRSLLLTIQEWKDSVGAILRGTGVGFFLGVIPGMNTVISAFMAYIVEQKVSKHPENFGTGVIQGVAGPETANNAFVSAAFIPLLSLGIPGSPAIAVLMGAFLMNGVTPGPLLFTEKPDLVWAVIASFFIGNVILLILNLPLIGMWVSILRIPYSIFFPLILIFCLVGSYSINGSVFDIGVMVVFSVLGYVFRKLDLPLAPAVMTFILGPMMEKSLRNSLEMSHGDFGIMFHRPISAVVLAVAACLLIMFMFMQVRGKGQSVREEQAEV
jgi:putative tricarboxylic transport membrane protein